MDYSIALRRHWWFDAGIAGLYSISKSEDERLDEFNVKVELDYENQSIKFQSIDMDNLRSFLDTCYEILAERYWNVSTVKQKENPELVVYDREKDQLLLMPKRKPTPVVSMFVGARSWQGDGIQYSDVKEPLKARLEDFLKETKSKLWGSKKLLLYKQPVCHQKIYILPEDKKKGKEEVCCVCGQYSQHFGEVGLPSFLLFASFNAAKSFNSQAKNPAKICWECEFISKFAIESASYKQTNDSVFIIQATSPDIGKLIELQKEFGSLSCLRMMDDKYFYSNIGQEADSLIKYCKGSYELLWAFMEEKYNFIFKESSEGDETADDVELDNFLYGFIENISRMPVQINMMHAVDSGDTFLTKNLIIYYELGYFYRLIHHFKKCGISTHTLFQSLYDDKNMFREKILKNVLKKNSILQLIEQFSFKKIMTEERISMKNILSFTVEYEQIIRGDEMNKEQVETAVNLGKQIVIQAVEVGRSENENEKQALKKIKGDLYQLRKARTRSDFLNQLNSLQFRYGIAVSKHILDGVLEEVDFEDFRAYCVLGALNIYNAKNKEREG
ncbi:MAG: hypothetical protein ACOYWZ_18400 [Bacillota bacterium]